MGMTADTKDHGVAERVKCGTLRWFQHVKRMNKDNLVEGMRAGWKGREGVRGGPPVRWIDRIYEYWRERVATLGSEYTESECQSKGRWRCFCRDLPLEGNSYEEVGH